MNMARSFERDSLQYVPGKWMFKDWGTYINIKPVFALFQEGLMQHIIFGTSGWRVILGEDFTFENVRVVVQAIADHVRANGEQDKGLIVGYDTRFMGERFAKEA